MTGAEIADLIDQTSQEVIDEANEYFAYYNEKGLKGDELRAQIMTDAAGARAAGREDLAGYMFAVASTGQGQITRRFRTSKGETVETTLTDAEAVELLREMKWSEFAQSLVNQWDKPRKGRKTPAHLLSDSQLAWVHKLANEQIKRKVEKQKAAPVAAAPSFPKIRGMFEHALQSGHKTPRITLDLDAGKLRLSVAGAGSRTPGVVQITDGRPYGDNTWYGRLELDGKLTASRTGVPAWVLDTLRQLNDETLAFVVKYGQKTGNCCFCNAELKTTESVTVGYGPICAERYGLPWG